jgi:hypothetical protein
MHISKYDKDMILFKRFFFLFVFVILTINTSFSSESKLKKKKEFYYTSKGFALVYDNSLYKKKVINKKLNVSKMAVIHSYLKRNTLIRIINPDNSKFVEIKVSKNASFPKLFNLVINKKIVTALELDLKNPYIEIYEIKKNKKFIAKKSDIFDEEKKVANKVPVSEVKINVISSNESTTSKKAENKNSIFTILISDFYYLDSAENLKDELSKKTANSNFLVKKINANKYRLSVGPFEDFNSLKNTYIRLNNLGFDDLNVYKE